MKAWLKLVSFSGLALIFAAALLHFEGGIDARTYYVLAAVGTVAWFGTVPFWMHRRLHRGKAVPEGDR